MECYGAALALRTPPDRLYSYGTAARRHGCALVMVMVMVMVLVVVVVQICSVAKAD